MPCKEYTSIDRMQSRRKVLLLFLASSATMQLDFVQLLLGDGRQLSSSLDDEMSDATSFLHNHCILMGMAQMALMLSAAEPFIRPIIGPVHVWVSGKHACGAPFMMRTKQMCMMRLQHAGGCDAAHCALVFCARTRAALVSRCSPLAFLIISVRNTCLCALCRVDRMRCLVALSKSTCGKRNNSELVTCA